MKPLVFIQMALLFFLLAACKKEGTLKDEQCRLTSVVMLRNGVVEDTVRISYNEEGKLVKVESLYGGRTTRLFTYKANQIIAEERFLNGQPVSTAISTMNADGQIASIYFPGLTGDTLRLDSFFYANGELSASRSVTYTLPDTLHATYAFQNGNCIEEDRGYKNVYSYLTRNLVQDADPIRYAQLLQYGAVFLKNKNLVKEVQDGSSQSKATYSYEFEQHAMISKAVCTSDAGFETEFFYGYECE